MFTKEFDSYVCEGDSITCTVAGFDCRATLYRDDCRDRPDESDCGFWPSLDPTKAGYIGPKSRHALARATAKAQRIMEAWQNDEWHYFGVAITVSKNGVELTSEYGNALWGIEGNWPGYRKGRNPNKYFRQVANELLPDAIKEAEAKLELLCDCEAA
jgi:hypothetical protein